MGRNLLGNLDINTIVNFLFIGAVGWIRSIEVRLRHVPQQTLDYIEKYETKAAHRMDRLEERMDKILSLQEEYLKDKNK